MVGAIFHKETTHTYEKDVYMSKSFRTAALILAAGKGLRMGGNIPKQYLEIVGTSVLGHTLRAFELSNTDDIIIVCPPGDEEYIRLNIVNAGNFSKVRAIVPGGSERFDSSACGLAVLKDTVPPDFVLIHDAARALVEPELINRVIDSLSDAEAVCPTVSVKDTIRTIDTGSTAGKALNRNILRAVQTPQGFRYDTICRAYQSFDTERSSIPGQETVNTGTEGLTGNIITDDAMLAEKYANCHITLIEGSNSNFKITTPEDMLLAEALLKCRIE